MDIRQAAYKAAVSLDYSDKYKAAVAAPPRDETERGGPAKVWSQGFYWN